MFVRLCNAFLDIEINTESKYTVILGNSGEGKTYIVRILSLLKREDIVAEIQASSNWDVVDSTDSVKLMEKYPDLYTGKILFIDEYFARKVSTIVRDIDAHFILVSRSSKVTRNCSYKDIYQAIDLGGKTIIQRAYPDFTLPSSAFTFDICITEDSGHGAKFFKEWFKTAIIYGDGKDTFSKHIHKVPHNYTILLIFDGGGIGGDIRKILPRINKANEYTTVYCCVPECFEQLLLYSSIVNYREPLSMSTVGNDTTEQFCKKQLETLSKSKPWQYSHKGKILSECWIIECADCTRKCEKETENKLEAILSTGPCKDLLHGKCSQKVHVTNVPKSYTVPEYYALLAIRKYSHSVAVFTSAHSCYEYFVDKTVFKCGYNNGYAVFYTFVIKTTKGLIVYSIPIKIGNKQYTNEQSFDYLYSIEEVQI